jgi:PncC family amidohydrolase
MADKKAPEQAVFELLREKGLSLAAAESCTGGLIAKRITDIPGASEVFFGGVVSYTNAVKEALLGVSRASLDEFGAVSERVAREMAEGVRRALKTDIGVSTTGLAGPGGDERGNAVGTVYAALSSAGGTVCRRLSCGTERAEIRNAAADAVFAMIEEHILTAR